MKAATQLDRQALSTHGFLPVTDPLTEFPEGSPYHNLDQLGHDLPSLLIEPDCRIFLKQVHIPTWQVKNSHEQIVASLPEQRLYYLRLGFICSGYINQVGQADCHELPANLAVPFCQVCQQLQRPAILSYDGYALYNWKRFDRAKGITLGNIDTLQNFVHLYDEHWFILVHVEIEAIAADIISAMLNVLDDPNTEVINLALLNIEQAMKRIVAVLQRIPEHMSPMLYFCRFRPYIRFFEGVKYLGVNQAIMNYRGETGAQSTIIPALVSFLKIPHQATELVNHLKDMRHYMPADHRTLLSQLARCVAIKPIAEKERFNAVLEQIALFREQHLQWARQYINDHVKDPRGTGGTPYMQWLQQLIDESRGFKHA